MSILGKTGVVITGFLLIAVLATEIVGLAANLIFARQLQRRYFHMEKVRIGISGYGNLGRGVELAIRQNDDMELAGIFTRRDPSTVKPLTAGAKVYKIDDAEKMKDDIDVMIICGGSATDLPKQTPAMAKLFNVIDSFDTHARIPEHFANVDKAAKESGHLAFISLGWDPGLFSLNRLYAESILPNGKSYTFWGKGVSQGHSDAIRRVEGVKKGIQYTIPIEAVSQVTFTPLDLAKRIMAALPSVETWHICILASTDEASIISLAVI